MHLAGASTSAKASVAYAAPGDLLAGKINRLKCLCNIFFFFADEWCEPVEMGSGCYVAAATAKFEIRRGPFALCPQVNGFDLKL